MIRGDRQKCGETTLRYQAGRPRSACSFGSGRLDTAPIGPFQDGRQLQVQRPGDRQRRVGVPGAGFERAELQQLLDVHPSCLSRATRSWGQESYYLATHGKGDKHMEFVIDRLQAFLDDAC